MKPVDIFSEFCTRHQKLRKLHETLEILEIHELRQLLRNVC